MEQSVSACTSVESVVAAASPPIASTAIRKCIRLLNLNTAFVHVIDFRCWYAAVDVIARFANIRVRATGLLQTMYRMLLNLDQMRKQCTPLTVAIVVAASANPPTTASTYCRVYCRRRWLRRQRAAANARYFFFQIGYAKILHSQGARAVGRRTGLYLYCGGYLSGHSRNRFGN